MLYVSFICLIRCDVMCCVPMMDLRFDRQTGATAEAEAEAEAEASRGRHGGIVYLAESQGHGGGARVQQQDGAAGGAAHLRLKLPSGAGLGDAARSRPGLRVDGQRHRSHRGLRLRGVHEGPLAVRLQHVLCAVQDPGPAVPPLPARHHRREDVLRRMLSALR